MNWDNSVITNNGIALYNAFLITLKISCISIIGGFLSGLLLGISSVIPHLLIRSIARLITDFFLAIPVLVLVIWLYYCLPLLNTKLTFSAEYVAILGLGLSLSAFVSEVIRGGINTIPKGYIEVAYCLGINKLKTLHFIILPQVIQKTWPALMGQFITTLKMSTITSIITVPELLHTGNNIISQTYRPIEIYTVIGITFTLIIWPLNLLLRIIEKNSTRDGIQTI